MDNKRIKMSTVKQILRLHQEGKGMNTIARIVGVSKNTVKSYVHTTSRYGLSLPSLLEMEDMALSELLNAPPQDGCNGRLEYFKSQLAYWEKELHRPGVTRYLLWQEYRIGQPSGYSYTQFCYHLQQHLKVLRLAAKTPADVFRNACLIALQAGSCHYRFIEQLITNGMAKNYTPPVEPPLSPRHENLRGKSFFN
jgi:hypothetical protein